MSFTYDLALTGDGLIISQIRLEIGDTEQGAGNGVKPPALANFSDAEILYFYAQEGNGILAAAARVCEVLARMWAKSGTAVKIRDYSVDSREKAKLYHDLAADLRLRSGTLYASGSAPTTKVDGYSNDVDSQDAGSGSEYTRERPVIRWP